MPHRSTRRGALLFLLASLPALAAHPADGQSPTTMPPHALAVRGAPRPTTATHRSPTQLLRFRGNRSTKAVIHSPRVYLVFYGRQWGHATRTGNVVRFSGDPDGMAPILQRFLLGLGGSERWSTSTTQYCDGVATGTITCPAGARHVGHPRTSPLVGVWHDTTYDAVSAPRDSSIRAAAVRAARHFHNDDALANAEAHYMVVMPPHVVPPGFGTLWCAYHSDGTSPVGQVTYTALPYVTAAGTGCGASMVHAGAAGRTDGVTMVAGHEYAEWLTDPFGTGWLDSRSSENADGCAWIDSGPQRPADVALSTGRFPVQSLWSNSADHGRGACVISYSDASHQG